MSSERTYYPLTHPQKRIWYLEKTFPDTSVNVMSAVVKFDGRIDVERLTQTLNRIIAAHAGLRLHLVEVNDSIEQYFSSVRAFSFPVVDFVEADHEARFSDWKCQQQNKPFAMLDADLFDFQLLRFPNRDGLFIRLHHIVSDGWTLDMLIEQILADYERLTTDPNAAPLEMPPYTDYIELEKEYENSDKFQQHREFWNDKFSTVPEPTNLATYDLSQLRFDGRVKTFVLPADLAAAVYEFCKNNRTSVFILFMSILYIYLARRTGSRDLVVGTAIHNRFEKEVTDIAGMFVSTIPFRVELASGLDLAGLLKLVRAELKSIVRHQKYPYDTLIQDLRARHLSVRNLYHIEMIHHKLDPRTDNVDVEIKRTDADYLTFHINDFPSIQRLELQVHYQAEPFSDDDITRLYDNFETLLRQAMQHADQPVDQLEMLSALERQRILDEFNDTRFEYPADQTIVDLFRQRVQQAPDDIAVVFGDTHLSFRQLDEHSERLAAQIRALLTVQPDDLIGLMLDRSEQLLVGMFGILKAGAAYVPVDPTYPQDRIDYMLRDSQCKVLITQKKYLDDIPAHLQATTIFIDDPFEPNEPLRAPDMLPSHLAYVIYTSGSTGRPKGVMIEHRNVVSFIQNLTGPFGFRADDRIYALTTVTFDISLLELICSVLSGIRVVIASDEQSRDADAIRHDLAREQITVLQITPSRLKLLIEAQGTLFLQGIRVLLIGGEPLPQALYDRINHLTDTTIINVYGPTETTVWSTSRHLSGPTIDIGKPLRNESIYILSREGALQPIGVPGEICIGGDGLGRGYLHQPDMTAEKFTPNPFKPGERIYHTGDVGVWLPDGNIRIFGRMDDQVKIRGFRIELGEIEHILTSHPDIQDAVVVARQSSQSNPEELNAYVVSTQELKLSELREYLARQLPDYMIPAHFVRLDSLPLTPNGKVDKKALPQPGQGASLQSQKYVAPRTPVEEQMAAIWREILELERVGIYDNFFEIGGHSLRATRMLSRIQKALNLDLSLRDVFATPTIAGLAAKATPELITSAAPIEPAPEQETYELSHAQRRLWVLSQFDGATIAYNIKLNFLLKGELSQTVLKRAFQAMVDRHESLRTAFVLVDGEPRQKISAEGAYSYDFVDLSEQLDQQRMVHVYDMLEASTSFQLENGNLLRVRLLALSDDTYQLIVTMHHIISDGWSVEIFMRELFALYEAFLNDRPNPLPPLKIDYKDYTIWQNRMFDSAWIQPHQDYWLDRFQGELPLLNLPADYPRPNVKSYAGDQVRLKLSPQLNQGLYQLSQRHGATLFMTLVALVKVLLYRYTGKTDLIIGTPIAGRNHPDLEDLFGFYVNMLPLRDELNSENGFADLLNTVKQHVLEAYDHQVYPFDRLVDDIQLARDVSRNPIFDVVLTLQADKTFQRMIGDLTVTELPNQAYFSKFDLTFAFVEAEDHLSLTMIFDSDLFHAERIKRLGRHFERLVEQIIADETQALWQLDLLTRAERQKILVDFNDTASDYPRTQTVVDLFEAQSAATPDRIALVFQDQKLTYRELNERANRLANALRQQYAIQPNDLIGIMVDRSEWMIIGLLAIIKAGGAYVPIDPNYPAERIRYTIDDSQCTLILTEAHYREKLAAELSVPVLDVRQLTSDSVANPERVNSPDDVIYVIYTSGSTGKPKGCLITHRNVVRLFKTRRFQFDFDEFDVWVMAHSFCFDFSVWEMYGALLFGGKLIMPQWDDVRDITRFLALIRHHRITVLNQTPGAFYNLIKLELLSDDNDLETHLRYVIFGGDKLEPNYLKPWAEMYDPDEIQLINMYGITETTVHVTFYRVTRADIQAKVASSPIGSAIPETTVLILDDRLKLVPVGIEGEIFVGGSGVTKGYLNRPDLTAERFIDNPFQPGTCLYKTGDLGRWLPDGNIEFLGRKDDQVKIRGYRIELGEIEKSLLDHPRIREAVVVARSVTDPGLDENTKQLIAYFVAETQLSMVELRDYLGKSLTDYMIPAHFVQLDHFPLTANGKINKKELPAPSGHHVDTGTEYVAPRNETETLLVDVWQKVLSHERISVFDNYFWLGGDSVRSIQIVYQARQAGLQINVKDIFQNETVASLAEYINTHQLNRNVSQKPPLEYAELPSKIRKQLPANVQTAYPVTMLQAFMIEQYAADTLRDGIYHFQQTFDLFDPELSLPNLKKGFEQAIASRPVFQTVFVRLDDGRMVQYLNDYARLNVTEIDLSHLSDGAQKEEIERHIAEDRETPFDPFQADEPLYRIRFFKIDIDRAVFFMSIHHAITDGWGNIEFLNDAFDFYRRLQNGEWIEPAQSIGDYREYVALEQEILDNPQAVGFWRQQLANWQPMPLQTRFTVDDHAFASFIQNVDRDTSKASQEFARQLKVSFKALILRTFLHVLSDFQRQQNLTVGVISNGRSERLSAPFRVFGLLWNVVPFNYELQHQPIEDVDAIQKKLNQIESFTRYPFPQIQADLNNHKLFYACLNFISFHNARDFSDPGGFRVNKGQAIDRFSFPLTLVVSLDPIRQDLKLRFEYHQAYLNETDIQQFAAQFIATLQTDFSQ